MTVDFPIKFMDVMAGVILGLGFQWWPALQEPWQYVAFIFVYLNLIDYWIDYTPTFKKFPLRNDLDIIVHATTMFSFFFLIYTTQGTIILFLSSFIFYRISDLLLLWRIQCEHEVSSRDHRFIHTWVLFDSIELILAAILIGCAQWLLVHPLILLSIFIIGRTITRVLSSFRYGATYFTER